MWAALGVYRFAAVSIQRPGGEYTRDSLRCYPVRLRSTRVYIYIYGVVIITVFYGVDRFDCIVHYVLFIGINWPINSSS